EEEIGRRRRSKTTRIETPHPGCAPIRRDPAEEGDPRQQGLKPQGVEGGGVGVHAEEGDPRQQGLKPSTIRYIQNHLESRRRRSKTTRIETSPPRTARCRASRRSSTPKK